LRATAFAAGLALAAPAVATPDPFDLSALVSGLAGAASTLDADLVNPWGHRVQPEWHGVGRQQPFRQGDAVRRQRRQARPGGSTIPANGRPGKDTPTGVVFNGTPDLKFATTPAPRLSLASFLFVSHGRPGVRWAPGITDRGPGGDDSRARSTRAWR
jgi:hypothetical protein